ncbi:hypothetical protein HCN44_004214 [Aphidius gifuensis]|uniref:Uncharacterized protein n=1 Tax=Aphidius gifuensis TaxID=684658 RepID=A0A835CSW5_APHGI|nr:uncharacterized protein LOC122848473 [Aphidius gifuensis]KAF7994742.1 hypothetical protein HCN44_004214 [Aphidius gifuensis]
MINIQTICLGFSIILVIIYHDQVIAAPYPYCSSCSSEERTSDQSLNFFLSKSLMIASSVVSSIIDIIYPLLFSKPLTRRIIKIGDLSAESNYCPNYHSNEYC